MISRRLTSVPSSSPRRSRWQIGNALDRLARAGKVLPTPDFPSNERTCTCPPCSPNSVSIPYDCGCLKGRGKGRDLRAVAWKTERNVLSPCGQAQRRQVRKRIRPSLEGTAFPSIADRRTGKD